jgi:hypothetical protein
VATNTASPFGFQERAGIGSAKTYEQVEGTIDYNTANIFRGDPVFRLTADGTLAGITTGPGPGTTPIAGIFQGCHYTSIAFGRTVWNNFWPGSDVASTNTVTGFIINDPNAEFLAQVGGSTTVGLVVGNIGANVQFAYGTGSTVTQQSGAYIDISVTPAVTSTLPFRVVSLVTSPPGAAGTNAGQYNLAVVAFNNVETKQLLAVNP